jgi:YD repeat-containing protein
VHLAGYAYDDGGRLAWQLDAMNHSVSYTYTPDDHVLTQTMDAYLDPDTGQRRDVTLHQYTYDLAGNIVLDVSGRGPDARTTRYGYQPDNRLASQVVDPGDQTHLNRETDYVYNADGTLARTDLNHPPSLARTSQVYDGNGLLTRTIVANDTGDLATQYTRDGLGHVLTVTDPRGSTTAAGTTPPDPAYTTTYSYDPLGRVSSVVGPPVSVEDGTGAEPATAHTTTLYGYNTFGETTDVQDPDGSVSHVRFDTRGQRTELDYPAYLNPDGVTLNPKENWTYDNSGNVRTHVDPRGQTTTYDYGSRNRVRQVTRPPAVTGGTPGTVSLAWDDNSNLLSTIDATGGQTLTRYDDMDRPMVVDQPVTGGSSSLTSNYRYDDFGDVTRLIRHDTEIDWSYNKAGEVLAELPLGHGFTRYTWDFAGRVTQVKDPAGRHTDTSYDQAGRVTAQIDYDSADNVLARTAYTPDPAGNVTAVTDPRGNTWQAGYDAANRVTTQTDPARPTPTGWRCRRRSPPSGTTPPGTAPG